MRLLTLALVVSACSGAEVNLPPTTTTPAQPVTTFTVPTTTATVEEGPCQEVFCVTYNIRDEAIWSDGTPVTAADFVYTLETFSDPLNGPAITMGYDLVETVEVIDDKTVMFGFSEVYGPWRTLFDIVLPAHVGDPKDLSVTASAFLLHDQVEDDRIVLRRNTNYWATDDPASGAPVGDIRELQFVFVESVRDRIRGLEDGELDVINPRPLDWIVADIAEIPDAILSLTSGPFWEHIDFNHDDPLLSQRWVREVLAMGMDREAILDATVRTIDPETEPLGNSVWMTNSSLYQNNYDVPYDPEGAEQILGERFCEPGDDGIYECQGRRLSFVWATTVGDALRETQAELVQESLEEIGVEIVIDYRTPSELFSADVFFGGPDVWQIINFSWKAAADPHLGNTTYYCQGRAPSGFGALNVNRYCAPDIEALIRSTDGIVEAEERAATYNEAVADYLHDLAIVPLYQKPSLLAWRDTISGPEPNMSRSTNMWNLPAWSGQESVVIALESKPRILDPVMPWDDDTALVMTSLLSGAFANTPTLEFVPVLIDGAETHESDH